MSDNEPNYDLEEGSLHRAPEPVSDTEVPFLTVVKILLVCAALLYIMTTMYESHVVSNPFGAGTGDKPTGLENAVPSSAGGYDSGIKAVPWK